MYYTITPINTGFIPTYPLQYHYHHSVAMYLKNVSSDKVSLPVFVFLIQGNGRNILVDTGMCWTERADKYHHPGSVQKPEETIIAQLRSRGLEPESIDMIIFTHLHWDHIFYMEQFVNAEYYVNTKEWAFANDPIPLYYKSYEADQLGLTAPFKCCKERFRFVSGETEIIEGIRVFETPGHSPGHQSVEIDTAEGKYICAGDSLFVMGNLEPVPELHYDITPPGRFYNIIEAWKSIELQKARMEDKSKLLLCHDINLLARIETTPVLGLGLKQAE